MITNNNKNFVTLFVLDVYNCYQSCLQVMPLENNMKTPSHFIGCPGVLNMGMTVVVMLYSAVGFFGFLQYGEDTKGSITLNLPVTEM